VNIWQTINSAPIGEMRARINDQDDDYIQLINHGGTNYLDDSWHLIHVTWNASSHTFVLYTDGSLENQTIDTNVDTGNGTTNALHIGSRTDFQSERFHVGELDEIRISNLVKSPEWISTEYNNQHDPNGFLIIGDEETQPPSDIWEVTITINGSNEVVDTLIFGEKTDASDGQDVYDLPKPSMPPSPYVYGFFTTNLTEPYNVLWEEYKYFPDTYKKWNLTILWVDSGTGQVNITWNTSILQSSEYISVVLHDKSADVDTDMLTTSYYNYTATSFVPNMFEIICSIAPLEYKHEVPILEEWNMISVPFNQTYNKSDITVEYSDVNYTWADAVTAGIVLDFFYGWNESVQNYATLNKLQPGEAYWLYAYNNCSLWIIGEKNNNDHITNLLTLWNFVGLPYDVSVEKENLTLFYDDSTYSWQDAVTAGIILDFIYKWNEDVQSYDVTEVLEPGKAFWVYAYYPCKLLRPT
jgi:hypothetical protein